MRVWRHITRFIPHSYGPAIAGLQSDWLYPLTEHAYAGEHHELMPDVFPRARPSVSMSQREATMLIVGAIDSSILRGD